MTESTMESSVEVAIDMVEKASIQVLHVDDEAGFLKVARQCLEMQGPFQVETAASVEEALEKMKEKTFDVVVSDYVMPGKDGLEFLKELREKGNLIPFIVFTGKGREEVAIKALNYGADQYLNKTGDPETVYAELAHGIRKSVKAKQAEERVKESEEKYRSLFENAKDVIVLMDLKGKVTSINKAAVEYGFKKDEVIGRNMLKFVPKTYWPKLLKELVQLARGKIVEGKIEIITPKGKKAAEYRSNPMVIDNKVVGVQTILRDITERKKAEEEMIRLSSAAKMTTDSIVISNLDGKIIDVNNATLKVYGTDDEKDLIGKSSYDLIAPEDREKALAGTKEALEKGYVKSREYNIITKGGNAIPVEMSVAIMKDMDGKPIGFVGISRDITERKQAEEAVKESEQKLRDVIDTSPDGVAWIDTTGKITLVNRKLLEVTGSSKKDLVGKNFMDVEGLTQESKERILENFRKRIEGIDTPLYEVEIVTKNKEIVPVELSASLIYKGDKIIGTQAILRDITERKKAETRVTQSERKYRSLVEMAPDGVATVDMKGVITSVNTAFARLTGYSKDEIVGKHFTKLQTIRARDIPKFLKLMGPALRGKKIPPFEYAYVRKDGTIRWGEAHIGRLKKDGKTIGFQAVLREITERKQAEKATRESQEKFRRLFMGNPEAAVYVDPDSHVLGVNPRFTELFGYSLDEIQGKHINKVVVPEDKMLEAEGLDNKALKGYVYRDTVRKRKDGSLVPVSVSAAPIVVDGRRVGQVGTYKDISQLKSVEKALRETMIKLAMTNEKLRVVGRLARHDVRNKLSAVTANTYLMKKRLEGDSEAVERLSDIESAVRETKRIFDFARTYEKLGIEKLVYMDVEKTFNGAVQQFSDLQVKVANDCSGLSVLADSLLTRLFYNLVHNSLMHGENVSKIRVYYEKEGDELKLVYEDDGVGIPKAEKEKVFREGYGKGTGYGLYLTAKMCEVYGWTIKETGKQGKGVQFIMTIPKMNSIGKISYRLPQNR